MIFNFPLLGNFNSVVCGKSEVNLLVLSIIIVSGLLCRLVFCTRYRFVIIPFLGNIKAFLSTYTPLHSFFHPVMLSFVFFLKKFRTLRNNVSYCFIVLSLFYCFLLYYFSVLLLYHYHYYYYYYYYFIIFISLGLSMNFS